MDLLDRKQYELKDLIRLVRVNDGLVIDKDHKIKGRGYYLRRDAEHIKEAFRKKRLSRILGNTSSEGLLKELIENV